MKKVIGIVGARNSGKSTTASDIKKTYPFIKGYISLSHGEKDEITLLDLENGNRLPLMSRYFNTPETIGSYHYLKSTFDYAERGKFNPSDIVMIDEIGRLECTGRGFDHLVRKLLNEDIKLILTIRTEFIDIVKANYNIDIETYEISEKEKVKELIKKLLEK